MNAPHSPDFSFNTLTGMLEPLKTTRRDKMRQNETVGARVPSAGCYASRPLHLLLPTDSAEEAFLSLFFGPELDPGAGTCSTLPCLHLPPSSLFPYTL